MDDERSWSRQLRRDRRATLATMEENPAMPGPGAAAAGGSSGGTAAAGGSTGTGGGGAAMAARGQAGPGGGGRFGGFVRGSALSGMMAAGIGGGAPATAADEDEAWSDDAGGLGGDQMESADAAPQAGGKAARGPSGPVTAERVKEAMKRAQENAQGGKEKAAAKAAALATKVLGEDRVAELANAVIREFTDPVGLNLYWKPMIWMYGTFFLASIVVIPLHWGYMLLGFIGIPKFNASVLKSFLFLINNCIFLVLALVILALLVGIIKGVACSHNPFCVIKLIKDYGSYFF